MKELITLEQIADQMICNSDHSDIDEHFKRCHYFVYIDGETFDTWADIDMSWEGLERYREVCDDIEFHVEYHLDDEYTRADLDRDIDEALNRFDDQETLDNPSFLAAAEDLLDQINNYNKSDWLENLWEMSIDHDPIADETEARLWLKEFREQEYPGLPHELTASELMEFWNGKIREHEEESN